MKLNKRIKNMGKNPEWRLRKMKKEQCINFKKILRTKREF